MPGSIKLEVSTEADARPTASTAPSLRGNKQTGYALGNKQTGYALALDSDKDTGSALDGTGPALDAAFVDLTSPSPLRRRPTSPSPLRRLDRPRTNRKSAGWCAQKKKGTSRPGSS